MLSLALVLAVVLEFALLVVLVPLFAAAEVDEVVAEVVPEVDGVGELGSGVGSGVGVGVPDVVGAEVVELPLEAEALAGLEAGDDVVVGGQLLGGMPTGSHCGAVLPEVAAVCVAPPLAGAASDAAATPKLVAETTRKPPAAILSAGRTCARRMKALPLLFVAPDIRVFSTDWRHKVHIASFVR